MSTMQEIADATGSTVFTVSRVLSGQTRGVRRDSRERTQAILAAAEKMNYRPNTAARSMRSKRSPHIGVLVRNSTTGEQGLAHPQGFETIMGINFALEHAGYVVSLVRLDDMQHPDTSASRIFRERVLEGMIVVSWLPANVAESVNERFDNCVWCDANTWQARGCIHRDERQAGCLATEAVIQGGAKKVIYFRGAVLRDGHYSAIDRRRGVKQACEKAKVELIEVESIRDHSQVAAEQVMNRIGDATGVVVATTSHVRGLVFAAAMSGKRPGHDFALACCDDTNELIVQMPQLTRVRFNRFGMGQQAAAMMLKQIEDDTPPESVLIGDELFTGQTHLTRFAPNRVR